MIKLDKYDKKILYELDKNCRTPISKIARKVRLSREVVNYRIKKLENTGLIEGYYPLINITTMGYLYVIFFIKLCKFNNRTQNIIIESLKMDPIVGWLGTQESYWDIAVVVLVKDIFELQNWLNKFNLKFSKYLADKKVDINTKVLYFMNKFLYDINDTSYSTGVGEHKKVEVDDLDIQILKELTKDCKIPITRMAYTLNRDIATIKKRISSLIKLGVLQSFKPIINYSLIGYNYYHVSLYLKNHTKEDIKQLTNYIRSYPTIIFYVLSIGKADIEFEIMVKSHQKLYHTIQELKAKFSKIIYNAESVRIVKVHKIVYMPLTL